MDSGRERVIEDMASAMVLGGAAFANYMTTRGNIDEIRKAIQAEQSAQAKAQSDKGITQLETYLATHPAEREVFEYSLFELYMYKAFALTQLGRNDVALKRQALATLDKALQILTPPADEYNGLLTLQSQLKQEIAKEDKSCFIATAAYGSPLAPEIVVLQHFRDTQLRRPPAGRGMIRLYERYSPPLADAIAPHPTARLWVRRLLLTPAISAIRRWFP